MSEVTYWSTRNGRNLRVMQTFLNRGHEEPDESRDSHPELLEPGGEIPPGDSTLGYEIIG